MAVGGIGGEGASPLDRFQQIRDLARKRMDEPPATGGGDSRARAADLLKRKQAELGQGIADRPRPAAGTTGVSAYGRAGGTEKADPKPRLGRYIDLTA